MVYLHCLYPWSHKIYAEILCFAGKMHFPREVWRRIFQWDRTYHEWFQTRVLPEIQIAVSKEMAELFFYFFMGPERLYIKTYAPQSFRYALDPASIHGITVWHTVEWMIHDETLVFRDHNEHTGSWSDFTL